MQNAHAHVLCVVFQEADASASYKGLRIQLVAQPFASAPLARLRVQIRATLTPRWLEHGRVHDPQVNERVQHLFVNDVRWVRSPVYDFQQEGDSFLQSIDICEPRPPQHAKGDAVVNLEGLHHHAHMNLLLEEFDPFQRNGQHHAPVRHKCQHHICGDATHASVVVDEAHGGYARDPLEAALQEPRIAQLGPRRGTAQHVQRGGTHGRQLVVQGEEDGAVPTLGVGLLPLDCCFRGEGLVVRLPEIRHPDGAHECLGVPTWQLRDGLQGCKPQRRAHRVQLRQQYDEHRPQQLHRCRGVSGEVLQHQLEQSRQCQTSMCSGAFVHMCQKGCDQVARQDNICQLSPIFSNRGFSDQLEVCRSRKRACSADFAQLRDHSGKSERLRSRGLDQTDGRHRAARRSIAQRCRHAERCWPQ
mmetsp:Transcript_18320/g.64351  ORF Transcript_18320/g.64351 Transcript_18320/m.64351 type:complete len:415 (-) Transcript_18320:34-1278(-)